MGSEDVKEMTVREPEYEFLDPGEVRLFTDDSGRIRLTVAEDRCYLDVKVVRAFPLSLPDRYLGFLNSKDRVIGLVRDPEEMDQDSRRLARERLQRRYFTPDIERIEDMKEEFGAVYFRVETDHGKRRFVVKGIRDSLVDLGDGELLMIDVDGNRYRVRDWKDLDRRSQGFLERVV
jgi:hypothetical protein